MKLNLGCSDTKLGGFVGVDLCPPADVIADLSERWPWEDNSIDEIRAWDIFEHLPSIIHTFNECWRVLKPGAGVDIWVPTTEGRGAWQDPTHKVFFNRNSFFYFTDRDPHRERFGKAYGIEARFRVVNEKTDFLRDEVVKLRIALEAVK